MTLDTEPSPPETEPPVDTAFDLTPAESSEGSPRQAKPMGQQAKWAMAALAILAAVALFWPKGDSSFDEPGGFLLDGDGRPQTLAPRLAPVTLVHFWATWCPPCITELPALDRLFADLSDRPDFDLVMIAVNDTLEKVEPFVGKRAMMMLYDPNWDVAHRYGTRKLPETYLVVDGRVIHKWEGAIDWDRPKERRVIEEALDARSSS
ncbi:MAG: TlpA disulfide reductase family protein [Acidobacteriota bacterium]